MQILVAASMLLLGTSPLVQDPAATPDQAAATDRDDTALREFAARVRARHWVEPREAPVDRFRAELRITPTAQGENRVQFDLRAEFVMPRFLRFRLERPDETVEGGIDADGAWAREGDRLTDLERGEAARDFVDQRRATRDYARLARQLLQFLDPAGTLLRLEDAQPPEDGEFRFGRVKRPCTVVVGRFDRFPLYAPPDPTRTTPPVQLTLWFSQDEAELFAVQAQPLGDDGLPTGPAERVMLGGYEVAGGIRLPTTLAFYRMALAPERLARVDLRSIELEPDLNARMLGRNVR